ncbi:hypothetical protein LJR098_004462 [Rhizobium sp. LjRoot98]|uniref:hypothetical protein n=1 Tax=unclassified Rhizobium TaxID=2613769 RepID=UPI000725F781|nr:MULTISPECIES: hypothetical protein [unclassified Rhizobium]KQY04954.1 hypothetical protein ASD36_10825 [Rhizobium sp. Root1334]
MRDDIIWQKIKTYHELDLPPDRENAPTIQAWELKDRQQFFILNPRRTKYGIFSFGGTLQAAKDSNPQSEFTHLGTNDRIYLSDWQISELARAKRIRPVIGPTDGARNVPGSSFALKPNQRKKAVTKLAYADGFETFMRENDLRSMTDEQKAQVIKKVAAEIGDDKPPGRSGWYKIIRIARTGNQYDRLVSFADNDAAKGNRRLRYGPTTNDAIIDAAQAAVAARGDWKTIRALLEKWSKLGGRYYHSGLPRVQRRVLSHPH